MGDNREPLVDRSSFKRSISHPLDEFQTFRTYLRWMCMDQSNIWTTCLSWFLFIVLGLVVPSLSRFLLACSTCDAKHARPYDWVIQLSLSSVSATSFVCLTRFVKKYGLKRFMFFDKLYNESETVRKGYTAQLNRSLKIVSIFVLPCFLAETAYKVWWYASGASQIPFLGIVWLSDSVACFMELSSWLYRTTVFFLVCVLFHLVCNLQVLRLQDFALFFQVESDVGSVLIEHLRIRRHLRIISHRFRSFILWCLILITGSQFTSLLITLKATSELNIYKAGELVMCSLTLLTGLCILLRSATKITHKAQAVTCLASKWHICATLDSFDVNDGETPRTPVIHAHQACPRVGTDGESESEDVGDEEDDLDNNNLIPVYAYSTISYQKRQALVTYFENNRAGITVYGFMLDRGTLHTIFGIELSLVLWLLGKTVVFS
ncbi:V-type proton ATPase subunit e-like [Hibiscus syriacus]|uniref:V-type proton ATPase subunit e-like n=1 Tax=Hibiscus syriacus TaxID=106335 RepID=A0A6A3B9G7_HIBSY|nr:uncharacterized protein LOC120219525 [Hibiscus syriacus]KAE8713700.1 V-type proton ATPase subunit e-like [Hibiscus syriacus]